MVFILSNDYRCLISLVIKYSLFICFLLKNIKTTVQMLLYNVFFHLFYLM